MYSLSKKILCLTAAAFVFSTAVFAQSDDENTIKLTVEKAVELALENNISIKQNKMDLNLLAKKDKYSWNSISPSLSFSGGINGGSSGKLENFGDSSKSSLSWLASGSLGLSFSPSLATSIKAARLAYEAGELSYESTKRQIEVSVRKTFYSLVYFNENLELQERTLETAKKTYESNLSKYNQGRLPEIQLLNSQYNYESRIPTVENLKITYQSNLDNFKLILGLGLSEQIELEGSLLDVSKIVLDESILNYDLNEIPAIKLLLKNIETAENSLKATKYTAYGPKLTLSGGVNSNGGIEPSADPSLSLSYGLTLNMPLDGFLPWSNGALNVATQQENLEKLKLNLEQTKANTALSIRNSYNSILQAQKQLELLEKNVDLMLKTYDMTHHSYDVGSSDLLSLQNAENNLYSARYNVQNQRYSIISSIIDLETTLGFSLVEDSEGDNK